MQLGMSPADWNWISAPRQRPGLAPSSLNGRLFQVEYAMEAISQAGTAMGVLATDGVILAAERKITSKLFDIRGNFEKIFRISEDIVCCVAGLTSDANILIDYARVTCQRWMVTYGEPIPVEQLVQALCNLKQSYTQHGGMRPFGVSFLYAGWDRIYGYQLYQSDPSGNYGGWKATCVGTNNSAAQSLFKTDYTDEMNLEEAKKLLIRSMAKTMESGTLAAEKMEFGVIQRKEGKTEIQLLAKNEVETMIKQYQAAISTESK